MLGECLSSLVPAVDEIVVVDTGSVDRSREIAREHGARVLEFAWRDDFSAARNFGLDAASGEWILYIDADERLRPISKDEVRSALSRERAIAGRVHFSPIVGYTPYWEYRLFRNDPRIRFTRTMHETVLPAIERVVAETGAEVADTTLSVDHVGYEGDQTHKHRRNIALLEKQLAETPSAIYHWHHLGIVKDGLGDEEGAVAAWSEGIRLSRRKAEASRVACLPYIDLLRYRQLKGEDVGDLQREAAERFPGNMQVAWIGVRVAMDEGRYEEAIEALGSFVNVDADAYIDEFLAYDRRMFEVDACQAMALCHFKLGRWDESVSWFEKALAYEPERRDLIARLAVAKGRAGRCDGVGG